MSLPENANVMAPVQGTVVLVAPSESWTMKLEAVPCADHAGIQEYLDGKKWLVSQIAQTVDTIPQMWMVLAPMGGFVTLKSDAQGANPELLQAVDAPLELAAADLAAVKAGTKTITGTYNPTTKKMTFALTS